MRRSPGDNYDDHWSEVFPEVSCKVSVDEKWMSKGFY